MKILQRASQIVTPLSNGTIQVIEDGAIVHEDGRIVFVGSTPEARQMYPKAETMDATGKVVVPGFVDAHTHAIFGGDRSREFLMKLRGATYQEIAEAGGGIKYTVKATRETPAEKLLQKATADLHLMLSYGTTTVEIKSGYGLNLESEKKILRVATQLKETTPLDVVITFLGAHDFPPEKSREDYIRELVEEMLPEVAAHQLAEFCDVFFDAGYYTKEETETICRKAIELGFKIKIHVDELADVNGASLASDLGATSADHLILTNEAGINKMAAAGVTAVLLPGTSLGLKVKNHAPARKMIEQGVRVAVATDFNPGTCYCHSMQYVMQLSTFLYGLTAEEALLAATLNGARAIDRADSVGSLEAGKQMDCLIFDIPHYSYLFYNLGINRLETVLKRGKTEWTRKQNLH